MTFLHTQMLLEGARWRPLSGHMESLFLFHIITLSVRHFDLSFRQNFKRPNAFKGVYSFYILHSFTSLLMPLKLYYKPCCSRFCYDAFRHILPFEISQTSKLPPCPSQFSLFLFFLNLSLFFQLPFKFSNVLY